MDSLELSILQWAITGAIVGGVGATGFLYRRTEKKVSKDVFAEFKIGNDAKHQTTHDSLKRIENKIDK